MIALAGFMAHDEDALVCDLAETYHIFDMRSLPVTLAATLSCGLRDDSRIKMSLRGDKLTTEQSLMALMLDSVQANTWMQTEDARHGRNRPRSVYSMLTGAESVSDSDIEQFTSVAEFEMELARRRSD